MINHLSLNVKREILAAWSSWLLKSGCCQKVMRAFPRSPGGGRSVGGRAPAECPAGHAGPALPYSFLPDCR